MILLVSMWLVCGATALWGPIGGRPATTTMRRSVSPRSAAAGPRDAAAPTLSIKDRLEHHFESRMKCADVPLFHDWETYLASLPIRMRNNEPLRLFELDRWTNDDDLQVMVTQLEQCPIKEDRAQVKYLVAPAGAGKTSSVLPAFVESAEQIEKGNHPEGFTHYVYLAFSNNGGRSFQVTPFAPSTDEKTAEEQGAAFALGCLKVSLERPCDLRAYKIPRDDDPPLIIESQTDLGAYLLEKFGPDAKILIHVDEHTKMCKRKEGDDAGAFFSKGALAALASSKLVTVIATSTVRPTSIPPSASSGELRDPVTFPGLDLDKLATSHPELQLPEELVDFAGPRGEVRRRKYASLRVRLGLMFTLKLSLGDLHRRSQGAENPTMTSLFLEQFKRVANNATMDEEARLVALSRLCSFPLGTDLLKEDANAAKLLLGADDEASDWDRQVSSYIVVRYGDGSKPVVSASIDRLVSMREPDVRYKQVYNQGRDRFIESTGANSDDLLSSTPLEASYSWTLACRSAFDEKIRLIEGGSTGRSITLAFKCDQLVTNRRLFPKDDSSTYDTTVASKNNVPFNTIALEELEDNVLYCVEELTTKHPLADLFFKTADGELVLIDVFGGRNGKSATRKKEKLEKWIEEQGPRVQKETDFSAVRGVVLAPLLPGDSTSNGPVAVVRGPDARRLLGGLTQIVRWFVETSPS